MLRTIRWMAVACTLLYATCLLVVYFGQTSFLYDPSHTDRHGLGSAVFAPWRASDGTFLGYVREAVQPQRVVVVFHGIGGEAINWAWYDGLIPKDQVLILAEYPGYGARLGVPSEQAILASAIDLVARLKRRWSALPLTAIGESLGTGVACYVASQWPVDRLALVSPFSSLSDVAAYHLPWMPVQDMLSERFPSSFYVRGIRVPLLIVHGTADGVVPLELGRKLFDAYPGKDKIFLPMPGFGHLSLNHALTVSPLGAAFRAFIAGKKP